VSEPQPQTHSKRPASIVFIACLFIVAGVVGFVYHARKLDAANPFVYELIWVLLPRMVAIVAGLFLLRGANWARWVLLAWMAYHVILSIFHSVPELATHGVLFAVILYILLRAPASAYFLNSR